jgi:hypothetical protein
MLITSQKPKQNVLLPLDDSINKWDVILELKAQTEPSQELVAALWVVRKSKE